MDPEKTDRYSADERVTGVSNGIKRTSNGIKLEPQPTDSPIDPLNWSLTKKCLTLGVISFSTFVGIVQYFAPTAGIVVQAPVYHVTPFQMAQSVHVTVLSLNLASSDSLHRLVQAPLA